MTEAEYRNAYIQARRTMMGRAVEAGRKIRREYVRVFAVAARAVRESASKRFLEERVRGAFPRKELYDFIMKTVTEARVQAVRLVAEINKKYIISALDEVPGHGLDTERIAAMFDAADEAAKVANSGTFLEVLKNAREYTKFLDRKTHSLSKSIWDTVNHTEEAILNTVRGSLSQGGDLRTAAADIMAHGRFGPTIIPGRWGKLMPGTKEYARRLGKAGVDYRVIRLRRSEQYRKMQENAIAEGQRNPACTGEYDWIRFANGTAFDCDICDDLAARSPYTIETVPAYPHPNCMCVIRPRLKTRDEFVRELKDYVNGKPGGDEIARWAKGNGLEKMTARAPTHSPDGKVLARKTERGRVDFSRLSVDGAALRESKWLIEQSLRTGNEFLSFIGGSGNRHMGAFEGTANSVTLMPSTINGLLAGLRNGTADCIHTHPSGKLFSAADMNLACRIRKLGRIIVALPSGEAYFLSVSGGRRQSEAFLHRTWETLFHAYAAEERERSGSRRLSTVREINVTMRVSRTMANMFGWRFGRL